MSTEPNTAPSYLLGQVVATATLLQSTIEALQLTPSPLQKVTTQTSKEPVGILALLNQELAPFEEALYRCGKRHLVEEMKRIYLLKDQCPFGEEALDMEQYQAGYQDQMEQFPI